jgi:hypothetical protein
MKIIAFTDYPIPALGDNPYTKAPLREVEVISYDGDEWCEVLFEEKKFSVKRYYLYTLIDNFELRQLV